MYASLHNKEGSLKHSYECKMAFGKKDKECPGCLELLNGSKPRDGWQKSYYKNKILEEKNLIEAINNHNCVKSNCGSVCTAFEH